MSTQIEDGGPAFANPGNGNAGVGYDVPGASGMSLRDYFAAHAPNPPSGWIGSSDDDNKNLVNHFGRPDNAIYAEIEWRWFWADQMLAARKAGAK